VRRLARVSRL
ncbi:hypothetical protein BN1723_019065, partial [Verticillium longisporum]